MYPDKELILEKLTTKALGRNIVALSDTPSTNTYAKQLAKDGAPHGTLVITARQTKGKGRNGRIWHSDDGSLCMSFIIRPKTPAEQLPAYTPTFANAAAEAMRAFGVECKIKWPNDIVSGGKKLCGILTEGGISGDDSFLVCGIGVNVNTHFEQGDGQYITSAPGEIRSYEQTAASLYDLTGRKHVREYVAAQILNEAEKAFDELKGGGLSHQIELYAENSCVIGREVNVHTDSGVICGKATGFDEIGRIIVLTDSGERVFDSADVSVRIRK